MHDPVNTLMVLLVTSNVVLLGTSRLGACIRIVAFQGVALGLLPLLAGESLRPTLLVVVVMTVGLRGIVFPMLLFRALRDADVRHEVEPYVGYTVSMVVGVAALSGSFWLAARLPLVASAGPPLVAPAALSTMLVGLFLIVSRKKAVTQVLGYLVLENGLYIFGIAAASDMPVFVELGVLLDVFVAVFVMSIATWRISREFDHIDIEKLDSLKG